MRKSVKLAMAVGALATTSVAVAAVNPVKERVALMNDVVLVNVKMVGPMIAPAGSPKGKPFDAAVAKRAFLAISEAPAKFVTLFPEGTEIGGSKLDGAKTRAKSEIWLDLDEFKRLAESLKTASLEAAAATDDGKDAVAALFRGKFIEACKRCHEKFRGPKPK